MVERDGWRLRLLADAYALSAKTREELIDVALRAAQGEAMQLARRSRHATTYLVRIAAEPAHADQTSTITAPLSKPKPADARDRDSAGASVKRDLNAGEAAGTNQSSRHFAGAELELFVKLFNPRKGVARLLGAGRRTSALRVASITEQLRARAFATPSLLLAAEESRSQRSLLVARRAEGELLPFALSKARVLGLTRKWALLSALGIEIARLHQAGFVHGDLTPYNILVVGSGPFRFVLLDHDRTFLPLFWRRRRQLRNLVQLGCRQFDFLSKTDQLRFFRAYAKACGMRAQRLILRRVNAMLSARRQRDLRRLALAAKV